MFGNFAERLRQRIVQWLQENPEGFSEAVRLINERPPSYQSDLLKLLSDSPHLCSRARMPDQGTLFHLAAENQLDALTSLLEARNAIPSSAVLIDMPPAEGAEAVNRSVVVGDTSPFSWEEVRREVREWLLMQFGTPYAGLETENLFGQTPLHRAAAVESPDALQVLLNKGADPAHQDRMGNMPLHLLMQSSSANGKQAECLEVLLDSAKIGQTYCAYNHNGKTPLMLALEANNIKAALQFINILERNKQLQVLRQEERPIGLLAPWALHPMSVLQCLQQQKYSSHLEVKELLLSLEDSLLLPVSTGRAFLRQYQESGKAASPPLLNEEIPRVSTRRMALN